MKTTSLFVPLLTAAFVSAHGFVTQVSINGVVFQGNFPNSQNPFPSIIRQVSTADPIKGAQNAAINCGPDATPGANVAPANPGDSIEIFWGGNSPGSLWIHDTGPMLTYMASCGDVSCDKFDTSRARWFKIDAQIRPIGNTIWPQGILMQGLPATVTLPSDIAPGGYILRHEIIALHEAAKEGGAEFYASCAQINVGGSGNGRPTDNELAALPGAYTDDDPGILDPNVFEVSDDYQNKVPGPPIAAFVTPSNGATPNDAPPGGSTPNDAPPGRPTSNGAPPGGPTSNGGPTKGAPRNVVPSNGVPVPTNGVPTNGVPTSGVSTNGVPSNGVPSNSVPTNGVPTNGAPTNTAFTDGAPSSAPTPISDDSNIPTTSATSPYSSTTCKTKRDPRKRHVTGSRVMQ